MFFFLIGPNWQSLLAIWYSFFHSCLSSLWKLRLYLARCRQLARLPETLSTHRWSRSLPLLSSAHRKSCHVCPHPQTSTETQTQGPSGHPWLLPMKSQHSLMSVKLHPYYRNHNMSTCLPVCLSVRPPTPLSLPLSFCVNLARSDCKNRLLPKLLILG